MDWKFTSYHNSSSNSCLIVFVPYNVSVQKHYFLVWKQFRQIAMKRFWSIHVVSKIKGRDRINGDLTKCI